MKEWKTAIVGCGLISKNHLKAINNLETVTCIAVCDIEKEKAEAADIYGLPGNVEKS